MTVYTRRRTLIGVASAAAAAAACKTPNANMTPAATREVEPEAAILPPEDLMREHGVLERLLLIYEDGSERLQSGDRHVVAAIAGAADIMRRFVEHYHEELEETWVFPRLMQLNQLPDVVETLRRQHDAGRAITREVQSLARVSALDSRDNREQLAHAMHRYVRMMRPHIAREDTVVFPAFRAGMAPLELAALGEQFENRERAAFGRDGFESVVKAVAELERSLDIYDLKRFTED
jgi:hemerythrin-like domain-containing protein